MSRLLLIRHGQTTSNLTHALDTELPGAALTALGWTQAHEAGRRLAEGAGTVDARPLAIVSSQALRARQTAAGIAAAAAGGGAPVTDTAPGSAFAAAVGSRGDLEVTHGLAAADTPAPGALPGMSEIPAGHFEMREDHDAHHSYHRTLAEWLGGEVKVPVPGALTGTEVIGRYLSSLLPLAETAQRAGTDLAVVSHGAVIRLIAAYVGRVDPGYAMRTLLPNTMRVELEVPDLSGRGEGLADPWQVTDWAGHGEPPRA